MTLAKVVLFSSLISATMIVWYDVVGMGCVWVGVAITGYAVIINKRKG